MLTNFFCFIIGASVGLVLACLIIAGRDDI